MTEQATAPDPIDVSRQQAERLCRHVEAVARHCRGDRHTPDERREALELADDYLGRLRASLDGAPFVGAADAALYAQAIGALLASGPARGTGERTRRGTPIADGLIALRCLLRDALGLGL